MSWRQCDCPGHGPHHVRWPRVRWGSWDWWHFVWHGDECVGLFRNKPGVVKWLPGHVMPRRWGFFILGFEFGRRS